MKEALEELQQAILAHVRSEKYQPVKPRVIAKALKIPAEEAHLVKKAVKALVKAGFLEFGSGHLVYLAGTRKSAKPIEQASGIIGVFRRKEAGHGFVRPKPQPGQTEPLEEIFIPPEWSSDAATGDLVRVRLAKRKRGRDLGPAGQIVEILERQSSRFVGTYFEADGQGYVQVDGTVFAQPIYVGDPGAHGVQPDDKVVIEMLRFPNHFRQGEGVIVEVLGPLGKPGVDTLTIMREFNLPEEFPPEVLEEARQVAQAFEETIPPDRYDATAETTITIDPEDARDFDDAVSLERLADGSWRLGVHIADVAYFVPPGSLLDHEARNRGTSVYLPDRVIPMLPELISNGLASLQPGKLRLTKSVYMEFTPEGIKTDVKIERSVIRSDRRLTYEQVDAFFEDPAAYKRAWGTKVHDLLLRMRELARILRQRRRDRGALELVMPEVKVDLDRRGRVVGAHLVPNTESHQIIEEFMLAANESVAETLRDRGWLFLRRIHRPPTARKLRQLQDFVEALAFPSRDLEDRFGLQSLLEITKGKPQQYAVHYAVLRSLQRAIYSPLEEGHYALASECYCHFTSPIRRYPDLTVHRLVDAMLLNFKPRINPTELVALGEHCSEREERGEAAERELTNLKLLSFLSERLGMELDGIVTGVEKYGLFVQGIALPADGFIPVEALSDDYYHFDRASHSLCGRRSGNQFRLGDLVRVAVARVDLERRQLDFRLLAHQGHPGPNTVAESLTSFGSAERDRKKDKAGKTRHVSLSERVRLQGLRKLQSKKQSAKKKSQKRR
ncbi:MAG: ribonuclease R [Thermogutta sp.]